MMKNDTDYIRPKKLKRAVIKEELVILTGDFAKALILNQFIYWSERVEDHDRLITEESDRMKVNGIENPMKKQYGWIYKKAEELSDELMLGMSPQTIRRHLKSLVDNGWLSERRNPNYSWDKTLQYRVDFIKIMIDLNALGYHLEKYEALNRLLQAELQIGASKIQFGDSNLQIGGSEIEDGDSNPNYGASSVQNSPSYKQFEPSERLHGGAIPENTLQRNMNECMLAQAETASTSNFELGNKDIIFEALRTFLASSYIADNQPMSEYHILQIYTMLHNQFQNQLDPEVVRMACLLYNDRTIELDTTNYQVKMKLELNNPVGFFRTCYLDAVKQYKASVRRG
ncbi:hypothetical protein AAXB25_34780 [Paenibacillus lautus]|uniref:hypothetical protein n=1 Tax=Paenibacillus lautus TaxID=1401 RepID=UPI003D289469